MKIEDPDIIDRIYNLVDSDNHSMCEIIDNPAKKRFEFIHDSTGESILNLSINDIKIVDKYMLEQFGLQKYFNMENFRFKDLFFNFVETNTSRNGFIIFSFLSIYFQEKSKRENK